MGLDEGFGGQAHPASLVFVYTVESRSRNVAVAVGAELRFLFADD